jgi:hypothetical protein
MVEVPESVTICVTSCGRLDLLQKTLASFNQFNRGGKFILSEDSADPEIIKQVRNLFPDIIVLHDEARTGLMKSIDRIYSKVETDFIFHLEDDWEFDGPVDWLSAIALLKARPEVANINVRKFEEIKPKWRSKSGMQVFFVFLLDRYKSTCLLVQEYLLTEMAQQGRDAGAHLLYWYKST